VNNLTIIGITILLSCSVALAAWNGEELKEECYAHAQASFTTYREFLEGGNRVRLVKVVREAAYASVLLSMVLDNFPDTIQDKEAANKLGDALEAMCSNLAVDHMLTPIIDPPNQTLPQQVWLTIIELDAKRVLGKMDSKK